MNIAFLLGKSFPNLSETFILNQITGLIERGHRVDIYADMPSQQTTMHPDVETFDLLRQTRYRIKIPQNYLLRLATAAYLVAAYLPKNPGKVLDSINIFASSSRARQVRSLRCLYEVIPFLHCPHYDIVHCHFGHNGVKALNLRKYGVLTGKLVTTFHGADVTKALQQGNRHQYQELFQKGDLFLPISETWRKKLIELGCNPDKIQVHHMGVDCSSFAFQQRVINTGQTPQIVTVCRLVEKKGVEYGIRAVAELLKRQHVVRYEIIGDGPLRPHLSRLIDELGIANSVHLSGWQTKNYVVKALENSHIMLAPSVTSQDGDQEGIPVALMEAMAMGIPVVSSLHSGIPELIATGVSGLLVPERDVQGLADKMETLINHPKIYSSIAMAASQQVKAEFDVNRLNSKLESRFSSLILNS